MTSMPTRGRPRDARVDERLLASARQLLRDSGYHALTVDAVTTHAGVGKAAFYRRYSSKAELAFAATIHDLDIEPPADSGSLEGDLLAFARRIRERVYDAAGRAIAADLMADLERDAVVAQRFRDTFLVAEQAAIGAVVSRAVERGELTRASDAAVLHLLVLGPLFTAAYGYHVPVDDDALAQLTAIIGGGLRAHDAATP